MKKLMFAGLALSLLIAAGAQRADRPKTQLQVAEPLALGWDPSDLSDEDAIRLSPSFVGTPWEKPESREGLVLSVDTAEGQLYLACLYARSGVLLERPETVGGSRAATKVVECCQKALALKPGYAQAYIVMSEELRILRRYKDAEAALESAIAQRPDWAGSYCQLAYVLVGQERYADALATSQQEVRLTQQAAGPGIDTGYWGPRPIHSDKNDILRLDHIQFKMEHPNDPWLASERIRALHLNHDPIGWLNPDNDNK